MDKIRVLLVEDEPTLAMIIKDTLDGEEFEVIPQTEKKDCHDIEKQSRTSSSQTS